MSRPSVDEVASALEAAGITGLHRSHTRKNQLGKIRTILGGDSDDCFGLTGLDRHTPGDVLGYVARLTGCSDDLSYEDGYDTIDPRKTVEAMVEAAEVLREAAQRGDSLLVATGHPTGMLECDMRIADAYRDAGGKILTLREEETIASRRGRSFEVRYTGGVACLADWGALLHTHGPQGMEALLAAEPWPDLVLGDHGWAGAAIERGIPTIAWVDINDPALAIAWAEGRRMWPVPLDDNRPPRLYRPAWELMCAVISGA